MYVEHFFKCRVLNPLCYSLLLYNKENMLNGDKAITHLWFCSQSGSNEISAFVRIFFPHPECSRGLRLRKGKCHRFISKMAKKCFVCSWKDKRSLGLPVGLHWGRRPCREMPWSADPWESWWRRRESRDRSLVSWVCWWVSAGILRLRWRSGSAGEDAWAGGTWESSEEIGSPDPSLWETKRMRLRKNKIIALALGHLLTPNTRNTY